MGSEDGARGLGRAPGVGSSGRSGLVVLGVGRLSRLGVLVMYPLDQQDGSGETRQRSQRRRGRGVRDGGSEGDWV